MFRKLKGSLLPQSEFIENTLTLVGGTFVSQLLPLIAAPLISRLYSPEDFSVYGVFFSIYGILGAAITLRYEMAIMLPDDKQKAQSLIYLCFFNAVVFSFILYPVFFLLKSPIINLLKIEDFSKVIFFLPVAALFLSINSTLIVWYNRNKQYKTISINRISRNTALSVFKILFGFLKAGSVGMVVSQIISDAIAGFYYLWRYAKENFNQNFKQNFSHKNLKVVFKEYIDFPKFTLPATFIDTLSAQIPVIFIPALFGTLIGGSYFFTYRILTIPIALLGTAYSQTFYQKFVDLINQNNLKGARKFILKSWLLLGTIIILPALLILFYGQPLFIFVFGNQWAESGKIASVLIFYITVSFISSPTSSTYIALRMQNYSLLFSVIVLFTRAMSFYVGYYFSDFYLGLMLFILSEICVIISYNLLALIKLNRFKYE